MELYRLTDSTASIIHTAFRGNVRLYPNPVGNRCCLEISLPAAQTLSVTLTDIAGKTVWTKEPASYPNGVSKIEIPAQQLAAGAYFYQLRDASGQSMASGKIEKQ